MYSVAYCQITAKGQVLTCVTYRYIYVSLIVLEFTYVVFLQYLSTTVYYMKSTLQHCEVAHQGFCTASSSIFTASIINLIFASCNQKLIAREALCWQMQLSKLRDYCQHLEMRISL